MRTEFSELISNCYSIVISINKSYILFVSDQFSINLGYETRCVYNEMAKIHILSLNFFITITIT